MNSDSVPHAYQGQELTIFARAVHWKSYVVSVIGKYIGQNLLEVGAGLGEMTPFLLTNPDIHCTCLEPDPELLRQLEQKWAGNPRKHQIATLCGTIADTDATPSFDTILYMDVLEHIENDADELRLAAERLKPTGHLIVVSPAHQWLFSPFDAAIGHFRRYNRKSLRATAPADLTLISLDYLDSAGLLASAANRLLLRETSPTDAQIQFWDRFLVPVSTIMDALFLHKVGKSIAGIWQKRC